jgi:hypothetical protein
VWFLADVTSRRNLVLIQSFVAITRGDDQGVAGDTGNRDALGSTENERLFHRLDAEESSYRVIVRSR